MDTNMILKKEEVPGLVLNTGAKDHVSISRVSQTINSDGYEVSITIFKPLLANIQEEPVPVFVFVPPCPHDLSCAFSQEEAAAELVAVSGHAALMVANTSLPYAVEPIFALYATVKWLASQGKRIGVNADRIPIVGTQLGANTVSVVTLMALKDRVRNLSAQILIDPEFMISSKHIMLQAKIKKTDPPKMNRDWIDKKAVFNLPLDSKISDMTGLPPTLVQLSQYSGSDCEIQYYCAKLLEAGTEVTYTNYDEADSGTFKTTSPRLNKTLLEQTAEALRKATTA